MCPQLIVNKSLSRKVCDRPVQRLVLAELLKEHHGKQVGAKKFAH
jgi:hypothetical protein